MIQSSLIKSYILYYTVETVYNDIQGTKENRSYNNRLSL